MIILMVFMILMELKIRIYITYYYNLFIYLLYSSYRKTNGYENKGGCRFNNGNFDPVYRRSSITPIDKVTVIVRRYDDPYIYCDDITKGCTGNNIMSNQCFGKNEKTKYYVGLGLTIAGGILFILIPLLLYCAYYCTRILYIYIYTPLFYSIN